MRTILFLLSPIGGGHASVAGSLAQAIEDLYPDQFRIELADVFGSPGVSPLRAIPTVYKSFVVHRPALWKLIYTATNGEKRYRLIERLAQPAVRGRLARLFLDKKPDVVVSVFPHLGYSAKQALRVKGLDVPMVTVVTDLVSIHVAWISQDVDWYVVPTPEAKLALVEHGIPPGRIKVFGLPVGAEFFKPVNKLSVRKKLGLRPDLFTILVTGGGEGLGDIRNTVQALSLQKEMNAQMIVVAGRNEGLLRNLEEMSISVPVKLYGFASNMADLMHAADVIVTKAGPSTLVEALSCGLPVLVTGHLPGQEEGNVKYVLSNKIGRVVRNPGELVQAVWSLMDSQDVCRNMAQSMLRLRRMDAAVNTAELIVSAIERIHG